MWSTDRNAVICDLAETYQILNYRALPITLLATLCVGLREDSRIKMKIGEMNHIPTGILLARIADELSLIHYALTAKEGDKAPDMLMDFITNRLPQKPKGFVSGEEFMKARAKILGGGENG